MGYGRNLCMKADQPAIAPLSTATGTRPPGLPVHHARAASSSSIRRGGPAVMSARFVSFGARRPAAQGRSGGLARGPHRRAVGRPGRGRAVPRAQRDDGQPGGNLGADPARARRTGAALDISAAWFFTRLRSAHRQPTRPRRGTRRAFGTRGQGRGVDHIGGCLLGLTLTASTEVSGPQRMWSPSAKLNPAAAMCSRDVLPRCPAAAMCFS